MTSEDDLIDIITLITKDRPRTPLKPRKGEVTSEDDLIDILITKDRARTPLKPRKGEGDELRGLD